MFMLARYFIHHIAHTFIDHVWYRSHFQKKEPKIIQYNRDYNNFSAEEYRCQYIISLLSSQELTRLGFYTFMNKCKDAFDIRVPNPIKHKYTLFL